MFEIEALRRSPDFGISSPLKVHIDISDSREVMDNSCGRRIGLKVILNYFRR